MLVGSLVWLVWLITRVNEPRYIRAWTSWSWAVLCCFREGKWNAWECVCGGSKPKLPVLLAFPDISEMAIICLIIQPEPLVYGNAWYKFKRTRLWGIRGEEQWSLPKYAGIRCNKQRKVLVYAVYRLNIPSTFTFVSPPIPVFSLQLTRNDPGYGSRLFLAPCIYSSNFARVIFIWEHFMDTSCSHESLDLSQFVLLRPIFVYVFTLVALNIPFLPLEENFISIDLDILGVTFGNDCLHFYELFG